MGKLFLAGIGGFIGSAARYGVAGYLQLWSKSEFPFGTLAVNFIGCLAIGFLAQLVESRGMFTAETRTLIFAGLLGGFTTFSAFGNETINLWRAGANLFAAANVAAHLLLCLGAVWLSRILAVQIWG